VSDLTAAYEPSDAESVVRGLKMIKDKKCVIIQDEISLKAPGKIYWFAHTKGQINVADDGRSAIVTVNSERMWIGIISDAGRFTAMNAEPLPTSPVVPDQTDNSNYRKLAVHLTNTQDTTISVACIPLKQSETQPSWIPSFENISEWIPKTKEGDVNNDGEFNISDVVLLQKWLLTVPDTHLSNWKAADLCDDNRLDVFDLCLMRRKLIYG
ncbi:dockerin type I repeat-containing protein, partial [Ruminococcus flavefaciens]|uniref:dockerin type I repeat-containing protein n=1 Tax=Ruminococcus flavefaciens TaxID=1265 RepID=UPI000567DE46